MLATVNSYLRLSSTVFNHLSTPSATDDKAGGRADDRNHILLFVPVASAAAVTDGIDYDSVHNIHIYYGDFGR